MKKVSKTTSGAGLSLRLVPITADDGSVRMEMSWTAPPTLRKRSAA